MSKSSKVTGKMVRVLIEVGKDLKEFAILELQGVLENDGLPSLAGEKIGDLHYDKKGTPHIIIGHHVLIGKVVELEKPFAVLKKRVDTPSNIEEKDIEDNDNTAYDIQSFVTQKIVFKNRPRPIITKTLPIKR